MSSDDEHPNVAIFLFCGQVEPRGVPQRTLASPDASVTSVAHAAGRNRPGTELEIALPRQSSTDRGQAR